MLNLNQFKRYLNIVNEYLEYENNLANLGINIWERDEINRLISSYIELISVGLELNVEKQEPISGYINDFDYWFYELEQGKLVSDYFKKTDKEYEGLGLDLNKVYNFLINNN